MLVLTSIHRRPSLLQKGNCVASRRHSSKHLTAARTGDSQPTCKRLRYLPPYLVYRASRFTSSRLALVRILCHSFSPFPPRPSSFRAGEARLHCFPILTTCHINTERRNYLDTAALSSLGKPSRLSCYDCPFHACHPLFRPSSSSLLHSITKHWPHINSLRHFKPPFILLDSFPLLSNFAVISATPHLIISDYNTTSVLLPGKGASCPQEPHPPTPSF